MKRYIATFLFSGWKGWEIVVGVLSLDLLCRCTRWGFSTIWSETGYCYVLYVEHGFQKIRKALTKKEKSSKYTSFELNFMGEFLPIFIL